MPQERLIGNSEVQVVLVESFDHKVNEITDKVISTLPATFRANGLPYLVEFKLDKDAEITNLKVYCNIVAVPNEAYNRKSTGLLSSLRSLNVACESPLT